MKNYNDYDNDDSDYNESAYLQMIDEERDDLDALHEFLGKKHEYREITYSKEEVALVEKIAIKEILNLNPDLNAYSESFVQKALVYYPELTPEIPTKKRRGKKSNMYFLEPVGRYLWETWNADKSALNQNNFVTYLFTIIDGVIFKYGRHKHGLSYGEVFQGAVIKLIQAMDKFDPKRQVGTDERGNPIYARVYTYFTMILNYGITTITMAHGGEKLKTSSYEALSRSLGQEPDECSDASIILQDLLLVLESLLDEDSLLPTDFHRVVYTELSNMLYSPEGLAKISNNLVYELRSRTKLKHKEIEEALVFLRTNFGPLRLNTYKVHSLNNSEDD
jgi:hypothetical protein